MKKALAILCLIIFSFQVIPVKAVGKLLSSGQTTEDVVHGDQPVKKSVDDDYGKFFFTAHYCLLNPVRQYAGSDRYYITDEALIKCLHLEVLLQPPNA